jgi:hypothetical protein
MTYQGAMDYLETLCGSLTPYDNELSQFITQATANLFPTKFDATAHRAFRFRNADRWSDNDCVLFNLTRDKISNVEPNLLNFTGVFDDKVMRECKSQILNSPLNSFVSRYQNFLDHSLSQARSRPSTSTTSMMLWLDDEVIVEKRAGLTDIDTSALPREIMKQGTEKEKATTSDEDLEDLPFEFSLPNFNDGQQQVFDRILNLLQDRSINKDHQDVLLLIMGEPGTGKTFLMTNALYHISLNTTYHVVCSLYIGAVAMTLPGSRTIHSLFHIPISWKLGDELSKLKADQLDTLTNLFDENAILYLDEVFAIRLDLMYAINLRLQQVRSNDHIFRGTPVITTGDPLQLEPVASNSLLNPAAASNSLVAKQECLLLQRFTFFTQSSTIKTVLLFKFFYSIFYT